MRYARLYFFKQSLTQISRIVFYGGKQIEVQFTFEDQVQKLMELTESGSGSGIGSSAASLERLTSGADWLEGKRLKSESLNEYDVQMSC